MEAPLGVVFDFNYGARIQLPPYDGSRIRKLRLFDSTPKPYEVDFHKDGVYVNSSRCFYTKFRFELFEDDNLVYEHDFCLQQKNVLILAIAAFGDTLAWLPYAERFREIHDCNMTVGMEDRYIHLFEGQYPHISIIDSRLVQENFHKDNNIYATYIIGFNYEDEEAHLWLPVERRHIGLAQIAPYVLGLNPHEEIKARVNIAQPNERPLEERYVCIGAQATAGFKMWANPDGWSDVVKYLTNHGYRVICIDKDFVFGDDSGNFPYDHIPENLENETGNRPLSERARWLVHADLFIGLGSGLSWLAWAVHTPVVLISGFSSPITEFSTPYRVINYNVCNSCWNDPAYTLDRNDWFWCPRHKGTPRHFECSRAITSEMVIAMIDKALSDKGLL